MSRGLRFNKAWWGVPILVSLLILAMFYNFAITGVSEGAHDGNLGFWEQTEPHPLNWDCWIWVNKGDHDVSLLWCAVPEQNQRNFRN